MIRRRRRLLLASAALLAAPLARAEQAPKMFRVGYVVLVSPLANLAGLEPVHPVTRGFIDEMRTLGYEEGRNLMIVRRSAEGKPARYPELIGEFVRLGVDVIVSPSNEDIDPKVLKEARVPVVVYSMVNPVERGFVASLARPGGNITGTTIASSGENEAKRLELLAEALPGISRVAYLSTRSYLRNAPPAKAALHAAKSLNVELIPVEHLSADLPRTFGLLRAARAQALLASLSGTTYAARKEIVSFALESRLPAMYPYPEMVDLGGLMAYGNYTAKLGRDAARYVARILRGESPAEMPVERPSKFEFVVNLGAARMLGLEIPQSILLRADRVIE